MEFGGLEKFAGAPHKTILLSSFAPQLLCPQYIFYFVLSSVRSQGVKVLSQQRGRTEASSSNSELIFFHSNYSRM